MTTSEVVPCLAFIAQLAEHALSKRKVTSSILVEGSRRPPPCSYGLAWSWRSPNTREILCSNHSTNIFFFKEILFLRFSFFKIFFFTPVFRNFFSRFFFFARKKITKSFFWPIGCLTANNVLHFLTQNAILAYESAYTHEAGERKKKLFENSWKIIIKFFFFFFSSCFWIAPAKCFTALLLVDIEQMLD